MTVLLYFGFVGSSYGIRSYVILYFVRTDIVESIIVAMEYNKPAPDPICTACRTFGATCYLLYEKAI